MPDGIGKSELRRIAADVSGRWNTEASSLLSSVASSGKLSFSRVTSALPTDGGVKPAGNADGYVLCISLGSAGPVRISVHGHVTRLPEVREGAVFLFPGDKEPTIAFESSFDILLIGFSGATVEELAIDDGMPCPETLRCSSPGAVDPILRHLASLVAALIDADSPDVQFTLDSVALALHSHLIASYGAARSVAPFAHGGLTPRQFKRARELMSGNLAAKIKVSEVAAACGLSHSHFARAFKQTAGHSPHRWLLRERVELAKTQLTETAASLDIVAAQCGFYDASHLSRVFSQIAGRTPSSWRRRGRCQSRSLHALA